MRALFARSLFALAPFTVVLLAVLALPACLPEDDKPRPEAEVMTEKPPHPAGPAMPIPSDLPERVPGALPLLGGYRSAADACQRIGEDAFTNQFLDDAADLVGCPEGMAGMEAFIQETAARQVGRAGGYVLFSVPRR